MGLYRYQPFDLTRRQVRLISLKPGPEDSPIECDLQVFDQDRPPAYIALSYTWGPAKPTAYILIGGQQLEIRQNLYDFLMCYRNDATNTHYIWIDQICISQAHTDERNHQVGMMARIYEASLYAIIWLGIGRTQSALDVTPYSGSWILRVLENEYFKRLWVIQEIILSPKQRILCGIDWIDADHLADCIDILLDYQGTNQDIRFGKGLTLYLLRSSYQAEDFTLRHVVMNFGPQQCEDPRDKVYGLMSIVRPNERIVIDYSKSVEEVFADLVVTIATNSRGNDYWSLKMIDWMNLTEHERALTALIGSLGKQLRADIIDYGFKSKISTRDDGPMWWYRTIDRRFEFTRSGPDTLEEELETYGCLDD